MFIQSGNFDDLATFPTLSKQGTLLPVVNVESFLIETRIILVTETACIIIRGLLLLLLLLILLGIHLLSFNW